MAEIDNWIKEQLKRGYKKEQIKEGLRKAGYPQDIIDSVDSLAKKRRNFNIALIFFIIIIAGIAFYFIYQNTFSNNEEVDTTKEVELSPLLSSVSDVLGNREETLRLLEDRGEIVNITSDGFEPKEMTIEVDQSISFLNKDTKNHTIITNTLFKTKEIEPTNIFIFIAREEGEFEFYFEEWPEIKGKVIVTKRTE